MASAKVRSREIIDLPDCGDRQSESEEHLPEVEGLRDSDENAIRGTGAEQLVEDWEAIGPQREEAHERNTAENSCEGNWQAWIAGCCQSDVRQAVAKLEWWDDSRATGVVFIA